MAERPEMVQRQARADDAVAVDAGDLPTRGAVGDAQHVAVLLGQLVERVIAAVDVAEDDDAVGVGLLEHRRIGERHVALVVDVAQEEPEIPGRGSPR